MALLLIVTDPLAAPATVGSNPMVRIAVCPWLRVIGAPIPDTVNPGPLTETPLIVSATVPDDVTVTACVVGVLSAWVPNATFVVLRLRTGTDAISCSAKVPETPPTVAVSVTVCVVLTADAVTANPALHEPVGAVTEAGTVTALLLVPSTTVSGPADCPVNVTVHQTEPAPVTDAPLHEKPSTPGCPVPLSAIAPPLVALLPIVTVPLAAPATFGSNPTVSVAVWPGFSVNGVAIPDAENPAPLTETPLIVRAAVPEDVTVTNWVVAVFKRSVPKAKVVELRLSPGTAALSCNAKVPVTPAAVAVNVAVCAALTDTAVAVNAALVAPAATVTEAGTVTAALLLVRFTVSGLAAAPVSVTAQASAPAPVSDALLHVTPLNAGCPIPLNAIVAALDALLAIVTVPVAAPTTAGSNPTVSVAVWPGFSVNGVLIPDSENPAPVIETPLIVRAAVPVDVTVTDCVAVVFSDCVPKATVVVLKLSAVVAAFSCKVYVSATPATVAVSVAVCAVVTAVAVTVNATLDDPAATVAEAGTVTALLLLVRLTGVALAAAPVSVIVQASVAVPVSDALVQEKPSKPACPVPLSPIVTAVALLVIVTVPLATPATVGSKTTIKVAVWPGFSVSGVLIPDSEKPAPVTETPLIVKAAVPVDVTVTAWVVAVFSRSVPKARLVELRLKPGTAAFSCTA